MLKIARQYPDKEELCAPETMQKPTWMERNYTIMEKIEVKSGIFIDGPEGVTLSASRCKSCGRVYFPKSKYCLDCLGNELENISLKKRGKLFSYTVGRMPSTHFKPPYAVGFVEMPEGIRIFAPLGIIADKPFKIGMEMEVHAEALWTEGEKEYIGYQFSPV